MKKILIVEDDRELNFGLCRGMSKDGYRAVAAYNLQDASKQLDDKTSLVLLDINLPDGSGIDFLKQVRTVLPELPVILLTSNDTDEDIVTGLEQGADDYITKPFSLAVLRARVAVQLRKPSASDFDGKYITGEYSFDFDKMIYMHNGHNIELSNTEQKLLELLVTNEGITIRRTQLIDSIWTDGCEYVEENALSVAVKRLRDKLNAYEYIKTVYGIGYRWERACE